MGRGGYDEGHCGWGRVTQDFLASGLGPRATVVLWGFSVVGACALYPTLPKAGSSGAAVLLVAQRRWRCVGVGGGDGDGGGGGGR